MTFNGVFASAIQNYDDFDDSLDIEDAASQVFERLLDIF